MKTRIISGVLKVVVDDYLPSGDILIAVAQDKHDNMSPTLESLHNKKVSVTIKEIE